MLAVNQLDACRRGERLGHLVLRHRGLAAVLDLAHGLLLTDIPILPDRAVDHIRQQLGHSMAYGDVRLLDRAIFKLPGYPPVGFLAFGDEHDAGGVAVEAMENPGPPITAGLAPLLAVVHQAIYQCAGPPAARGMDH